jgi:hypothetical protein
VEKHTILAGVRVRLKELSTFMMSKAAHESRKCGAA